MSLPMQHFSNGALGRRRSGIASSCWLFTAIAIIASIWNNNNLVYGAPAQLGGNGSEDAAKTVDSYGNLIESLKPIETPDGRKVVSAQGLQFEIPTYASGITELRKPTDDLLPPFVDPIVVALPNDTPETLTSVPASDSVSSTTVEIENAQLTELETDATAPFKGLPKYIVDLNDPDIDGPVEYMPSFDQKGLSVLAWDLLPPVESDPMLSSDASNRHEKITETTSQGAVLTNTRSSSEEEQSLSNASQSSEATFASPVESTTKFSGKTQTNQRGSVYFSSTTPTTTTTRRLVTTTTTPAPTPTPTSTTTTTTRRTTTTPRTIATTTTTTSTTTRRPLTSTTSEPDTSEFFKLEGGDSYTLPPWLAGLDYADLDVAVAYAVPEDNNEYNHTISKDILPPLEPFTDLNSVDVTPPTTTTTTTRRTTTSAPTTTTTTTTPKSTTTTSRRPPSSSAQAHWVRAKGTPSPGSSGRSHTSSSFRNHITTTSQTLQTLPSLPTSFGNSNIAQRTSTTTTTTVKPKTTSISFNRPLSTTDKLDSSAESPSNAFPNGANKPLSFSKTTTSTTTKKPTTTTTTTQAPEVEPNPFEPTIPPWLKGFDYPDVGPGVPFVYDPKDDEEPVEKNMLPPSPNEDTADTTKATFINSQTTATSFLNSQNSPQLATKFSSTSTSLTSSPSSPSSKVTLPLPSIQTKQDEDNTLTQAPSVFVAPSTIETKTSSNSNKNFAARLDPTNMSTSPTKVPLGADRESFPPFNIPAATTDFSLTPQTAKKTFSKSEDGKVITNNIFLNGPGTQGQTSTKQFAAPTVSSNEQLPRGFTKSPTASTTFNELTTLAGASGFVTASAAASRTIDAADTKYTGRFGGPPGILAPNSQPIAFAASSQSAVTQSFNNVQAPGAATSVQHKFTGSFGGPPGVLTPYDNVKSG